MLVNTFAIAFAVTFAVTAFSCYLLFGHVLLGTAGRHRIALPTWVRTLSVTVQFTMVYFAPMLNLPAANGNNGDVAAPEVAGGGNGENGVNGGVVDGGQTERERIIAEVGAEE